MSEHPEHIDHLKQVVDRQQPDGSFLTGITDGLTRVTMAALDSVSGVVNGVFGGTVTAVADGASQVAGALGVTTNLGVRAVSGLFASGYESGDHGFVANAETASPVHDAAMAHHDVNPADLFTSSFRSLPTPTNSVSISQGRSGVMPSH